MRLRIFHNVLIALLTAVLVTAPVACGGGAPPGGEWSEVQDSSGDVNPSQPAGDGGGGGAAASNSDTVSYSNPNAARMPLNDRRDIAPDAAARWTP